ncbi:alpha/beta hydrolase-fold protein [Colwelliaceae bacterium BS250]
MIRILIHIIVCSCLLQSAHTEASSLAVQHQITSKITDKVQKYWLHLPQDYKENNPFGYPVMYLYDGNYLLNHTAAMTEFLNGSMPNLIIVGIESQNRNKDLTPDFPDKTNMPLTTKNPFFNYIEKELIPHINSTYNTADYRIVAGHSLGGLAVLHNLINQPSLFNAHFAFSPAVHWQGAAILDGLDKSLTTIEQTNFLYIGREALDKNKIFAFTMKHHNSLDKLEKTLEKHAPKNLDWHMQSFANEDHFTVAVVAQHYAFRTLYPEWFLRPEKVEEDVNSFDQFYQNLSAQYGYSIAPTEYELYALSDYLTMKQQPNKAVYISKRRLEFYPASHTAHRSLANAYYANKNPADALKHIKQAILIATEEEHDNLTSYKNLQQKFLD